jgi:hypothetical protein
MLGAWLGYNSCKSIESSAKGALIMQSIHQFFVFLHIVFGAVALIIFWIPVFNKKGSKNHIRVGKIYEKTMVVICISGIISSVMAISDPIGIYFADKEFSTERAKEVIQYSRNTSMFLLMLSFLVLASVRHGILAVQDKAQRVKLRSRSHVSLVSILGILAAVVLAIGVNQSNWLLIIFSAISLSSSFNMLRYCFKTEVTKRQWIIEHLNAMAGSGIGVYTAFSAFGGRKVLSAILPEQWLLLSWLFPAVIGTLLIVFSAKKFRKRYKVGV